MQPSRMNPWIALFCQILETDLGSELTNHSDSWQQILHLNKQPSWKLKGYVAQITLKLF